MGLLVSLICHALVGWTAHEFGKLPQIDLELSIPNEIDISVLEPQRAEPEQPAPAVPEVAEESDDITQATVDNPNALNPEESEAKEDSEQKPADESEKKQPPLPPKPTFVPGRVFPNAAYVALQVNFEALRDAPYAPALSRLLTSLHDWQRIAKDSGIDPVRDLERVYLTSPNLSASRFLALMEYREESSSDSLATRLASIIAPTTGQLDWQSKEGLEVARWPKGTDNVERALSRWGGSYIALSRYEDLALLRALTIALAGDLPDPSQLAERVLAIKKNTVATLRVDHLDRLLRGRRAAIAENLRLTMLRRIGGALRINARATFANPEAAQKGLDYWEGLRQRAASNVFIALVNMNQPLETMRLERRKATLRATIDFSAAQVIRLLNIARQYAANPSSLPQSQSLGVPGSSTPPTPSPATPSP